MRKKNVLVIVLTALIFLSVAVLGVSTVYRVNAVSVRAPIVSEAARSEAEELQKKLTAAYEKQSIFSTNDELAKEIVAQFPYFNLTGFEKKYPSRLVVEVTEEAELYACVAEKGGYYILSIDGTVLGIREDYKNRSDNADNLLIEGLAATGEKGEALSGDSCLQVLFPFLEKVSEALGGIRRNVLSVSVLRPASVEEETVFKLTTREGVNIYVRNPAALTAQKAEIAIGQYQELSTEQKLKGMLIVSDVLGEVIYDYHQTDSMGG
ncbi:MAG: hypothetical protein J6B56_01790 [Clostridia bacterium]|nr:hypothetical protein [Clostridia bacterium]